MLNNKTLREQYRENRRLIGLPGLPTDLTPPDDGKMLFSAFVLVGCLILAFLLVLVAGCQEARADNTVDMSIISTIESSNNPKAHNNQSGATGLCQITEPALREFNTHFHKNYSLITMYDGQRNLLVADWYMNDRIPAMLRYFGIPQTVDNRLWAYNAGIGQVRHNIMSNETKDYIKKYHREEEKWMNSPTNNTN